jgi:nudix motif 8
MGPPPVVLDAATLATMSQRLAALPALRAPTAPRQAAVLVPFCTVAGAPALLFTLRSAQLRSHRGEVSFPGGKVEPGESVEDAAEREFSEELGAPPQALGVRMLGKWHALPSKDASLSVTPVVVALGDVDVAALNATRQPGEVAEVFAVPLAQLMDPARVTTEPVRTFIMPRFHVQHSIWGMTAIITAGVLKTCFPPPARTTVQFKP